jgi:protein-S-isoprenylcysteine O-methyltransferase Ste14
MLDEAPLKHAGVPYPPPLLYVVGIVAGKLLHRIRPLPITGHPSATRTALAIAFGLGWLLVFGAAWSWFLRRRTTIIPNRPAAALVTNGIYRYTRNPMYVSLVLLYIGVTLALDTWWPLLFLPLVVLAVDLLVIRREERYLRTAFPSEYAEYCQHVRRWI